MYRPAIIPTSSPASHGGSLHTVTAAEGDAGERLDRVLAAHLGEMSRSRLKQLILDRRVTRVEGEQGGATITDPSMRVKPGERFAVAVPAAVADRPSAQAIPLDIR